jgi:DnaJ-class molecular chaperone
MGRTVLCPRCHGRGVEPSAATTVKARCRYCSGAGYFANAIPDFSRPIFEEVPQ